MLSKPKLLFEKRAARGATRASLHSDSTPLANSLIASAMRGLGVRMSTAKSIHGPILTGRSSTIGVGSYRNFPSIRCLLPAESGLNPRRTDRA